eukprot:1029156-Pyramimonas_sp.AAC.1
MISDRVNMHLRIRPRRQRPQAECAMPAFIIDSRHYLRHVQHLPSEAELRNMTATAKWRAMEAIMTEAAKPQGRAVEA